MLTQYGLQISLNENVRLNLGFSFMNDCRLALKRSRMTDLVMEAFKTRRMLNGSIVMGNLEKKPVKLILEQLDNDTLVLKTTEV